MHVVLHIGSEKTGTTSIQRLFATTRDSLRQHGVLYPETFASPWGHHGLAALAHGDPGSDTTLTGFAPQTALQLAKEVEQARGSCQTVVLSCELLGSRLREAHQVERVRAIVAPFAEKITVVLYARNPVALAESQFAMTVAAGNVLPFPTLLEPPAAPLPAEHLWPLDAHGAASLWARVLGDSQDATPGAGAPGRVPAQVLVRPYHRPSLRAHNVIDDFAHVCGMNPERDLPPQAARHHGNPSLERDALAFFRAVNLISADGLPTEDRPSASDLIALRQVLVSFRGGGPFRLPESVARRILSALRPSYTALVAEYLDGDPADLLALPDTDRPATLDTLDVTPEIAVRAVLHLVRAVDQRPPKQR